ncbi:MAG: hypothetical protein BroJett040_24500 [Oligoflexia bacterium]|nr:MAG: hypothetical protein BroJett040_24500 [Oligoflexia bacterium]
MKTKIIFTAGALILVIGGALTVFNKSTVKTESPVQQVESKESYTCPMHPHIRQDHPGTCPICHMKLVKVKAVPGGEVSKSGDQQKEQSEPTIEMTTYQKNLSGIQKHSVEKMDLQFSIPISGRILSNSQVAFQIYERDIRTIRPGLKFVGEAHTSEETEIQGVIISVDTIVDPTSRTVRVVGQIQKGPSNLISETSFRGEVEVNLKSRLAIPEDAVFHTGHSDTVYVFRQDVDTQSTKLVQRKVKLGVKALGYYEVLSGLKEADEISSGPNFLLDSESKIRGVIE